MVRVVTGPAVIVLPGGEPVRVPAGHELVIELRVIPGPA